MKRAAALLLLAALLLALSGCGCGGLEPALEAVRGWDAARAGAAGSTPCARKGRWWWPRAAKRAGP